MVGGILLETLPRASLGVPQPPPGLWLITQVPAYRDCRGVDTHYAGSREL